MGKIFLIIFVLCTTAFTQTIRSENDLMQSNLINKQKSSSINELKQRLSLVMMEKFENKYFALSTGESFQLIGAACGVGFLLTVFVFKEDIFSTVPLSLLAAGIIFVFLGSAMEG